MPDFHRAIPMRSHLFAAALAAAACVAAPTASAQRATKAVGWSPSRPAAVRPMLVAPPAQDARRVARTAGKTALQLLASSAGATGLGLVTYFMFQDVGTTRVKGDDGYTRPANAAYLIGSTVGAALGAQVVGHSLMRGGALWATTAGAIVGTAPLIAMGVDEPWLPVYGLIYGWPLQAAGATIGYHLSRQRD